MQRRALLPDANAIEAARYLLHTLSRSKVSPEALLRAIPCYPLSADEISNAPRPIPSSFLWAQSNISAFEEQDSFLGEKAESSLRLCHDCWDLLQPDVVTRLDAKEETSGEDDADEAAYESPSLGRHSWFVLEWLVRLFERDQLLCGLEEGERTKSSWLRFLTIVQ